MAIALVNHSNLRVPSAAGTAPAAAALNVSAGNLLVVALSTQNTPFTVTSITDTAGNTYVDTGATVDEANGGRTAIWYAKNSIANASNVVTVHISVAQDDFYVGVFQYSGCDTSSPLDVVATGVANNTGSSSVTSGSFTPAAQGGLTFFSTHVASVAAPTSWNTPTGFVNADAFATFPYMCGGTYDTTGSSGAQTATISVNGGSGFFFAMSVACFKAQAATAGTGVASPQFTAVGGATQTDKTSRLSRLLAFLGVQTVTPTLPQPNIGPPMEPNWPVASTLANSLASSLSVGTPRTAAGARLIYAVILYNTYANTNATPVTISGLGLSWTQVISNHDAVGQTGAEIWAAWASGPLSPGTVTATFGAAVTTDAVLVAYARFNVRDGSQSVLSSFGVSAKSVDMTGNFVPCDITLTNVLANSGAVMGVVNGAAAGTNTCVPETDTIKDALIAPRGSIMGGTFQVLTGNTIAPGGGGGGGGGGVPTTPPANGTTLWHPAAGDTTYVDPTQAPYNARGDGITDDRAAFQAAANTRKPMFVPAPPGGAFYKMTGFVQYYNSVYGDGSMPKLQMFGSTGDSPGDAHNFVTMYFLSVSGTSVARKFIQGITVDGGWNGGSAGEYSHCISMSGCAFWTIQYCNISNAYGDDIWQGGGIANSAGPCDSMSILHNTLGTARRCNCGSDWGTNFIVQFNKIIKQNSYVAAIDWEPDVLGTQSVNGVLVDSNEFHVVAIDFNGACVNLNNPNGNPPSGNVTVTNNFGHWSPVASYMNVFPDSGGLAGVVPNEAWSNLHASNNVVTTAS